MEYIDNTLQILRSDFANLVNGYPTKLPMVTDINETEVEEVREISYYFETIDEAKLFSANFPKSYFAKVGRVSGYDHNVGQGYEFFYCKFEFNIFYTNGTTGDVNESAILRRSKVIAKIKKLQK